MNDTAIPIQPSSRGYPLDNRHPAAEDYHSALADLLNPFSMERVAELVGDLTGWRTLEVGAGGGSFARWLAREVGPAGDVLAVDINTAMMVPRPPLRTAEVDITDPLQLRDTIGYGWDLIHARLVLQHLPAREHVLHRLASLLAPDGLLLIEDWYTAGVGDMVIAAPTPKAADTFVSYQALAGQLFEESGSDRRWARDGLHQAMLNEGLADVDTMVHGASWQGGGPGCQLLRSSMEQLRPRLLAAGLSEDDLSKVARLLEDPRLHLWGFGLYSTSGRRR